MLAFAASRLRIADETLGTAGDFGLRGATNAIELYIPNQAISGLIRRTDQRECRGQKAVKDYKVLNDTT